ncbi:MAG TPA: ribokinase [Planctomycetota bacterium]|nr:ribokinase [Planctomycetota bacterium]
MSVSRIVVVGSSNTDMVIRSARLPGPGETVLGGEFLLAAGGKGANQAVSAARAGARVTLLACVGDDVFGRQALAGFEKEGIDTAHVRVIEGAASGIALIMVGRDGENIISVASGANMLLSVEDVENARDAIEAADGLLCQLETPVETVKRALGIAREAGVLTVLNPAPARQLPPELLALVDVLTPNRTELFGLVGADPSGDVRTAARKIRETGIRDVVVTLGSDGALIVSDDVEEAVSAFEVNAVDAVAAGDVFSGTLTVALTEGKPLRDASRFACAASAISVTRPGARPSVPRRPEIEAFLAKRNN